METLLRCSIKDFQINLSNIMLVAVVIGKQETRRIKLANADNERGVWNFTIRDSPHDYINVAFWGEPDTLTNLCTVVSIGSLVEITNPRVILRTGDDVGEYYRPTVTSPFQLIVGEEYGNVARVSDYSVDSLSRLINLPTKPLYNYTTLGNVHANIHTITGNLVDLLVAVRQVGEVRFVNTKNGLKQVRNVVIFDNTNPGMALSFWNEEYIVRASLWKPRDTILFITDCRVNYDSYSNGAKGTPSMKSIITVDPEGKEVDALRLYVRNAVLSNSSVLDQMFGLQPDPTTIKTVMNVRNILHKIEQIGESTTITAEDQQFAVVLYATVTFFDIDGFGRIYSTRCSLCKSVIFEADRCKNPVCLSNTSDKSLEYEKTFDIRMEATDRTGTLKQLRLNGKNAETLLRCTPSIFMAMSDDAKSALKWEFLMELCELRLMILVKNKRVFITVLTCERADITKLLS